MAAVRFGLFYQNDSQRFKNVCRQLPGAKAAEDKASAEAARMALEVLNTPELSALNAAFANLPVEPKMSRPLVSLIHKLMSSEEEYTELEAELNKRRTERQNLRERALGLAQRLGKSINLDEVETFGYGYEAENYSAGPGFIYSP